MAGDWSAMVGSGRSAAWLARLLGVQEVASSNLAGPTKSLKDIAEGVCLPCSFRSPTWSPGSDSGMGIHFKSVVPRVCPLDSGAYREWAVGSRFFRVFWSRKHEFFYIRVPMLPLRRCGTGHAVPFDYGHVVRTGGSISGPVVLIIPRMLKMGRRRASPPS